MKLTPEGCIDSYNGKGYFQVRHSLNSTGYRLYFGDSKTCSQVSGEINGKVWETIQGAVFYCWQRFKEIPLVEKRNGDEFPTIQARALKASLETTAKVYIEQAQLIQKLIDEKKTKL